MSFYSDASLVLIPSGYKDQKVYSAVPTDGSGDLVFSRASSATRVQSNGLIEKVRSNRFTYSQALANAAWLTTTDGGTITKTANAGTAPDGTNTATRIQIGGGGTYSLVYQSGVNPLGLVVISGYFKRYGSTNQTFRLFGDNGSALSATLTATDTWQRFSYVMNASSTGADGIAADASNNAYDILVWGMQIESGDIATDYIATTSAAVSVGPVSGLPRLDYLNSTCPRLLLEPQRSNLALYSEQMTLWQNGAGTMTANQLASPDGAVNADKFDNLGDCGTFVAAANGVYTWSLFVKQGTSASASIDMSDGATGDVATTFTFSTKTFSNTTTAGSWTSPSTAYQDYGNGWYRLSLTATKGGGSTIGHKILASGIGYTYVWGAQVEAGAYATSYIPTLGTSVTRVADAATKTGISSLIGQTEGTLFAEFVLDSSSSPTMAFFVSAAGVFDNAIWIQQSASDSVIFRVFSGSSAQASITKTGLTNGQTVKVAGAYKANDFVLYVNGVQVGTDTSGSIPASLSQIEIGSYAEVGSPFNQNRPIKQAILFPTRLSNSDLAALTA